MQAGDLARMAERYGYTRADVATLNRVLARPCHQCGAPPGTLCSTPTGKVHHDLDHQHLRRRIGE